MKTQKSLVGSATDQDTQYTVTMLESTHMQITALILVLYMKILYYSTDQ